MADSTIEYYPDPVGAFNDGCLMDLRFRTAMQLTAAMLQSGQPMSWSPHEISSHAINIVDELFSKGKEKGWIEPLPESGEINSAMRRHLERAVKAQLYQQQIAQREQASAVRPIMNG